MLILPCCVSGLFTDGTQQRVWFLAPTVALCLQQYEVLRSQIPAVQAKVLRGADGVDHWSGQVWDSILQNVRIVVSTYQILLQVLIHAFVRLDSLALIVFDEGPIPARLKSKLSRISADYPPSTQLC